MLQAWPTKPISIVTEKALRVKIAGPPVQRSYIAVQKSFFQ
jgi:hypothetical protein